MTRKILFFDVDGTIVTGEHVIPETTVLALRRALAAGHVLFINTGRPFRHVEPQIKALPVSGFICSLGGMIRMGEEVLLHRTIPAAVCERIRDLGYSLGMDMLFESEEAVWFDRECANPNGQREIRWLASIGVPARRDTRRQDFAFDKFVCWPREGGQPERFRSALEGDFTFIGREHGMMEVVPRGQSKAEGMRFVMDRLGIRPEDSFAFGDGANDLPMLRAAAVGVLLGNAPRELWPEADYIAPPIHQGGLAAALEHFGLA